MYGGHAKRLPESNLAHLQPALLRDRQNRTVQKDAVRAANIQLESSSLSLSFTPTLQSSSNPSCSFLVSRASRIFLYFRWEEREGEKKNVWTLGPASRATKECNNCFRSRARYAN